MNRKTRPVQHLAEGPGRWEKDEATDAAVLLTRTACGETSSMWRATRHAALVTCPACKTARGLA